MTMKRALTLMFVTVTAAALAAAPAADKAISAMMPLVVAEASVVVKCPLTVGGGFEAKTNALDGELSMSAQRPGEVDGTLVVDLKTLETGISLRDTHMREQYLEVQKGEQFAAARLNRIRLAGIEPASLAGNGTFTGMLTLHGVEREVTGKAEVKSSGESLQVLATFPVKVSDFNIQKPRYLGVGVKDQVTVAVRFQTASKRP
jgi:polyisoprenoid-binding protein YceI